MPIFSPFPFLWRTRWWPDASPNFFNCLNDTWLHFHENGLLAIGRETIILFTKAKKASLGRLLHLRKIGCLIMSLMIGRILNRNDHPALQTNPWLQCPYQSMLLRSQISKKIQLQWQHWWCLRTNYGPCCRECLQGWSSSWLVGLLMTLHFYLFILLILRIFWWWLVRYGRRLK